VLLPPLRFVLPNAHSPNASGKPGDDVRIVVKSGSYASSLMRKMLY
jgi:hypothetical protein